MASVRSARTCPGCGPVLATRPEPNHVLHLVLSFVTGGFWIPVWGAVAIGMAAKDWRCPTCGAVSR